MIFLKSIIKFISKRTVGEARILHFQGAENQLNVLKYLIKNSKNTSFGKDHDFGNIKNYYDFSCQVKIRDYEGLKSYVERTRNGEKNVLWKGHPLYFAKTSGTTSGAKYIPITKDSIGHHIRAARNALFSFVEETGRVDFFKRKMIFLQGSPANNSNNIHVIIMNVNEKKKSEKH